MANSRLFLERAQDGAAEGRAEPVAEVLDLKERFRCRRYHAKERAVVSINRWDRKNAGGSAQFVQQCLRLVKIGLVEASVGAAIRSCPLAPVPRRPEAISGGRGW